MLFAIVVIADELAVKYLLVFKACKQDEKMETMLR